MPHIPGHNEATADPKLSGFRVKTKADQEALKVLQALASQYPNILDLDVPEVPEDRLTSYSPSQSNIFEQGANLRADSQRLSEVTPGQVLTGASMVPGVGEVLDFANIPYSAFTGRDMYSGQEMTPAEASAWAVGGLLIPNVISGVGKQVAKKIKDIPGVDKLFKNLSDPQVDINSIVPDDIISADPKTKQRVLDNLEEMREEAFFSGDFDEDELFALDQQIGSIQNRISTPVRPTLRSNVGKYELVTDPSRSFDEVTYQQTIFDENDAASVYGAKLNRSLDKPDVWDLSLQVEPGSSRRETAELIQAVTDNIMVGDRFQSTFSTDSYDMMLKFLKRRGKVVGAMEYRPLNRMGGEGASRQPMFGLTQAETERLFNAGKRGPDGKVIDHYRTNPEMQKIKNKVDSYLKEYGLPQSIDNGAGIPSFPNPVIERIQARPEGALFKKGGYATKKKRKQGYSIKR